MQRSLWRDGCAAVRHPSRAVARAVHFCALGRNSTSGSKQAQICTQAQNTLLHMTRERDTDRKTPSN